jgi:hypothetical protein
MATLDGFDDRFIHHLYIQVNTFFVFLSLIFVFSFYEF